MNTVTFWFDPISPYAHLAFEQLPQALAGCSYVVDYRPVLFAGLLKHWGQKGPAEIGPKRDWTYRQIAWHAHALGIEATLPAQHPFNPMHLLRLALACAPAAGLPSRHLVEQIFHHVWCAKGADANEPARLLALRQALAPARDPQSDEVKAELRGHGQAAIARGVFGVPSIEVDDKLFWGLDALPMLRAYLQGDAWFAGAAWGDAARERPGLLRTP